MNDGQHTVCTTTFRNPPEKCAEWLTLLRNGSIEAEIYDFSPNAQRCYGSDISFILTLDFQTVRELMDLIRSEGSKSNWDGISDVDLIRITQRFETYHEFKEFCNLNKLPYSLVFDGNA